MARQRPRASGVPRPRKKLASRGPAAPARSNVAPRLAEVQAAFQAALLAGDDRVLPHLLDSSRAGRAQLLEVYRHAYVARLTDVLRGDQPRLAAWFGEERFDALARAYLAAHPSDTPNVRHVSRRLPEFLSTSEPWRDYPAFAELSRLEQALADVFDAADKPVLALSDLASIAPDQWQHLVLEPVAATRRLELATNAAAIWLALEDGREPPAASPAGQVSVLVWRRHATPSFRVLSAEEAMLWDEAAKGVRFGVLCELIATYVDPDGAPARVAGYLQGWLAGELLAGAKLT